MPVIINTVAENMACHAGITRNKKADCHGMSHQNKQHGGAHAPPGLPPPDFHPRFHSQQDQSGGGNGQQHFRNQHEFIKGVYQFRNSAETLSPGMKDGSAARRFRMKSGSIARGQQKKGPAQRMESPANEEPAGSTIPRLRA